MLEFPIVTSFVSLAALKIAGLFKQVSRYCSHDRQSAVDDEILSRHPTALVAGEIDGRAADIPGPAEPAQRMLRFAPRESRRRIGFARQNFLSEVGEDQARTDGVHAHAMLR